MQVRDAIRIVFPESVTLVREARGESRPGTEPRQQACLGCADSSLLRDTQVDRRQARNGEAGAATIEHAGLSLLVALIAVGLLALASSPSPAGRGSASRSPASCAVP